VAQEPRPAPVAAGPITDLARLPAVATAQYHVFGRIRLLVAWVGWRDVGEARIAWLQDAKGDGYELLIGTDPARAPFGMNNWGYVLEESTPGESTLLGLMTEAEAASANEARKDQEKADKNQVFKRIRGTVKGAEAWSEVSIALVNPARSYHDLRPLLRDLPVRSTSEKRLALTPGTRPGMLTALAELLAADAATRTAGSRARRPNGKPRLPYTYNGTLYDLTLNDSRFLADARFHGDPYGDVVQATVRIDNRLTREKTEFTVYYKPAAATPHVVPVRVIYRPKWWLELELLPATAR